MTQRDALIALVRRDTWRLARLREARTLGLSDWWLAAGFVRNAVWDHLHGYARTPLNDIDLIHFDAADTRAERDAQLEACLRELSSLPWSVKNQARMHQRHGHAPYASATHAMRFWVERETAVGVRLERDDELTLSAPLGVESLMAGRVTPNPHHAERAVFHRRLEGKRWLERWPHLET